MRVGQPVVVRRQEQTELRRALPIHAQYLPAVLQRGHCCAGGEVEQEQFPFIGVAAVVATRTYGEQGEGGMEGEGMHGVAGTHQVSAVESVPFVDADPVAGPSGVGGRVAAPEQGPYVPADGDRLWGLVDDGHARPADTGEGSVAEHASDEWRRGHTASLPGAVVEGPRSSVLGGGRRQLMVTAAGGVHHRISLASVRVVGAREGACQGPCQEAWRGPIWRLGRGVVEWSGCLELVSSAALPARNRIPCGDTRLFTQKSQAGKSGGELLIESVSPERETRKRKPGKRNPLRPGIGHERV
ncbi:hypothetical protein KPP03845_104079 [Streptomyces xanthophaeus]|nr:hypothetical protein KPP03845_104079 [Streptomyces xanthophaeus]